MLRPMPAPLTFLSLGAFYSADPVRRRSRERDFGLWWRSDGPGPTFRAAWVQDTGEVYLVQHGLIGSGGGHVEVVARIPQLERVDAALRGWRDEVGTPGSLSWLRDRVAGAEAGARLVRERALDAARYPANSRISSVSCSGWSSGTNA
ncbi:MAG: hypothetical protein JWN32_1593 [Solirubrobacterales bacterium]|nr:hypothetical protein [Solirubrobacterales bacterium]